MSMREIDGREREREKWDFFKYSFEGVSKLKNKTEEQIQSIVDWF